MGWVFQARRACVPWVCCGRQRPRKAARVLRGGGRRSLRSQQQEVEDRRAQLQQRMRLAEDPSRQGKKVFAGCGA